MGRAGLGLILLTCVSAQTPERVVLLEGETHHVQGLAKANGRFLVTSVERGAKRGWLMEFDGEGKRLREIQIQTGDLYHPGGIDVDESSVWIPVAEYRPKGRSRIERRSIETFEVIGSFDVPDHIGAVAVSFDRVFLANWDARQIYEYSRDGRLLSVRDNPSRHRFQDLKLRYGTLIGAAAARAGSDGGFVVWMDPETLTVTEEKRVGRTERGVSFVNEGLDLRDGRLYLMPEDAPTRIFVVDLMGWRER